MSVKSKYYFDKDAAERPIKFIEEFCRHVKGELTGQKMKLMKWEKDEVIRPLFGWKRKADDLRRYRSLYLEVPRKNDKTTLSTAIMLYLLVADGEKGAEVYTAAGNEDQARISYGIAASMIESEPRLNSVLKCFSRQIYYQKSDSFMRALSRESKTKHGFNAHGVIIDEVHIHEDEELIEALETSTGSRSQPLVIKITTAGIRKEGSPGWETHKHALKVKNKTIDDPTTLVVMYGADEDDDPFSSKVWKKANPGYGKSLKPYYIEAEANKAKIRPSKLNTFKRLHLNIWTGTLKDFIPDKVFRKIGREIDWGEYEGRQCVSALDLSKGKDFTCFTLLFEDNTFKTNLYIPQENIHERKNSAQILTWADQGFIKLTPGRTVDQDFIKADVMKAAEIYDLKCVAYDDWNTTKLVKELEDEGIQMVEVRQGYKTLSPATKAFEKMVLDEEIFHDNNPALIWQNSNVTLREDPAGNIKPDKQESTDSIDAIVTVVMCVAVGVLGDMFTQEKDDPFADEVLTI